MKTCDFLKLKYNYRLYKTCNKVFIFTAPNGSNNSYKRMIQDKFSVYGT